jgi:hypothetical protein
MTQVSVERIRLPPTTVTRRAAGRSACGKEGSRSATGARLLCSPRDAKWVLDAHPADEAAVLEILGQ